MTYQIGYAKPPLGSRFQPGTSGNPRGRPKGSKNYATLLEKMLTEVDPDRAKGEPKVSTFHKMIRNVIARALAGDRKSLLEVMEWMQKHDNTPEPESRKQEPAGMSWAECRARSQEETRRRIAELKAEMIANGEIEAPLLQNIPETTGDSQKVAIHLSAELDASETAASLQRHFPEETEALANVFRELAGTEHRLSKLNDVEMTTRVLRALKSPHGAALIPDLPEKISLLIAKLPPKKIVESTE